MNAKDLFAFTVSTDGVAPGQRNPAEVVREFIKVMNLWERAMAICTDENDRRAESEERDSEWDKDGWSKLAEIFEEYCTSRDRKYSARHSFQVPPEYDPERETIVEVREKTKGRAEVFTDPHDRVWPDRMLMYVLLRKGDNWLIDSKKRGYKGLFGLKDFRPENL